MGKLLVRLASGVSWWVNPTTGRPVDATKKEDPRDVIARAPNTVDEFLGKVLSMPAVATEEPRQEEREEKAEEKAPEPTEPPKLVLPVLGGQRVQLRNGERGYVEVFERSSVFDLSKDGGEKRPSHGYVHTGQCMFSGAERPEDVVLNVNVPTKTVAEEKAEEEAKAKAKLLAATKTLAAASTVEYDNSLPLKKGQRIKLNDGTMATIIKVDTAGDARMRLEDGADKGTCFWITKKTGVFCGSTEDHQYSIAKEAPKLTLPLVKGQKVICADGQEREVTNIRNDGREWDLAYLSNAAGQAVWANNGKTHQSSAPPHGMECVSDAPSWKPKRKRKAKAKPKVTLPLTVGQRVVCANGDTRTVATIKDRYGHPVAQFGDGIVVYAKTGRTDDNGSGVSLTDDLGGPDQHNVVKDAE